jgi:tetratricopeptide (TPR) repeat protein
VHIIAPFNDHYTMHKSFTELDQTLKTNPADSTAWYEKGDELANAGRHAEALACFNRAVQLQPVYCAAWVFRGAELIHLGRYQEALESCDRALELEPKNTEAWIFKGAALQQLNRYDEAYACYDKALGVRRNSGLSKIKRKLISRLRSAFVSVNQNRSFTCR